MSLITVIIPYYQCDAGVLAKALRSIATQQLPDGWHVEIIVVDDESPHPAQDEVESVSFSPFIRSRIVKQSNGGAATARNRGLDEASHETTLIAFLDSDDIWPQGHLALGIQAHALGYDFCFSDNRRAGHHTSHIHEGAPKTAEFIAGASTEGCFVEFPNDLLVSLVVEEFPSQASTVLFRRQMASALRFDQRLGNYGEDVLYFVALASLAKRPCFNARTIVECGSGVNVFFGQLDWDSPTYMDIQAGHVRCYSAILRLPNLAPTAFAACKAKLRRKRRDFVFHAIRRFARNGGALPPQARALAMEDIRMFVWFPISFCFVLLLFPLGKYKP